MLVLNFKLLKLSLGVFLASHNVVTVIKTYLPMAGQYFDTMIVASSDQEWL